MPGKRATVYVVDANGDPVVGLRIHRKTQRDGRPVERYFAELPDGTRKYFGTDADRTHAIFQFRQWEARRNRKLTTLQYVVDPLVPESPPFECPTPGVKPPRALARLQRSAAPLRRWLEDVLNSPMEVRTQIPDDVLWMQFASMLQTTPLPLAAQKLGIPEIRCLTDLTPPEPPAKLTDVLALYLGKRKRIGEAEAHKTRAAWNLFASATQARTLADIDQDAIGRWEEEVFDSLENGNGKPKTVRHRMQRVTRVLRHAARKRVDPRNAERVLALIKAIDLPTAEPLDPMPISVEDFHKLYGAADETWKAFLLISLNACFYPQDIRTLPIEAVDLEQACLRFRRKKTGVARVAMLWPETQKAIRHYLACRGHNSGVLIRSARGAGFTYAGFYDAFGRLNQAAGTGVKFNQIRDGAYTAACTTGVDSRDASILAGHRCGMSDAYVLRKPQRTQAAVDAIRKHYRISQLVKRQKPTRQPSARGRKPQDS